MDREIILLVHERRGACPAGAEGVAAERLDRVFVAVLRMNGLAAAEIEGLAAGANLLPRQADEMHLDAALFAVVARAMAEGGRVEFAAKLVIDAREQVEVEGRRNAGMVVVGGGEYVGVFDEIDADHEQRAGPEYRRRLAQQHVGLGRFEVSDGGAGEKADARPIAEPRRK